MPLIAARQSGGGTTPPAPIRSEPIPLGLVYVDPDGVRWDLRDRNSGLVLTACSGIASPPVRFASLALPGGGAYPQSYSADSRTIVLGLLVDAATQEQFLDRIDRLAFGLWTERNGEPAPGKLIVQRPGGTSRQCEVFVTEGADQSDDDGRGLTYTHYALTFTAPSPYWSDETPTVREWKAATGASGVPPMPPVNLAPASVLGETYVINDGNAPSYPVWTITGPGTPTLHNTTTGRSFGFGVALAAGETVTVDTRRPGPSAVDGTGADRWGDLTKSSPRDLWPLVQGRNDLSLTLSGSSSASTIRLSYTRQWLRA